MSEFEDYIYKRASEGIVAIKDKTAADIYALSFYHWADEDDPRKATLTVGYNTNARWRACTPAPGQEPDWPIASDSDEAKWNFAFWLQEKGEACVIGESRVDATARKAWIVSQKLWWTDKEQDEDFDRTLELGEQVMDRFVDVCINVAKRLHKDGIVAKKFGRPIPILVHELEYHDGIAEATRKANPKKLAKEFENWIAAM